MKVDMLQHLLKTMEILQQLWDMRAAIYEQNVVPCWHACSQGPNECSVMANGLRSAQQILSSSQGACTSCKSLGQPGFYSLT